MITKLTKEHEKRMPEWVDKWVRIGLSTEPADWEMAERGALECYAHAKLPRPMVVLRMGSPFSSTLGGVFVCLLLSEQVRSQVWSQVGSQVESQVGSQVCVAWQQYRGAQLWASWYSWISFYRDVMGWEASSLIPYVSDEALALSCGWTWWHDKVVAISDRPRILKRDDRGFLHNEEGPALLYPDGWSFWRIHGVEVPELVVIRPETQTIKDIDQEPNAEVKRIRIERFGWPRYLKESGAKVLNMRKNAIDNQKEALMQSKDGSVVLVCSCPSTARVYAMRVPKEIQTCEQAQNWLSCGLAGRMIAAT